MIRPCLKRSEAFQSTRLSRSTSASTIKYGNYLPARTSSRLSTNSLFHPRMTSSSSSSSSSLRNIMSQHGPASSSSSSLHSSSFPFDSVVETITPIADALFPLDNPVRFTRSILGILTLLAILKYRDAIQRRLEVLQKESWLFGVGVRMVRVKVEENDNYNDIDVGGEGGAPKSSTKNQMMSNGVFQNLKLLELNPEFQQKYAQDWQMVTLGDYMSTLRPKGLPKKLSVDDMPMVLQREIEAGLAAGLLKALGPSLGRAVLPAVGSGFIQKKAQGLATNVATKWMLSSADSNNKKNNKEKDGNVVLDGADDKGSVPVPLMTLLAIADVNARLNSGSNSPEDLKKSEHHEESKLPGMDTTAMEKMLCGEVVKGLSFCDDDDENSCLVPNDFVVSKHFDVAIRKMEQRLGSKLDYGGQASTAMKIAQEEVLAQEQQMKETTNLLPKTQKQRQQEQQLKHEEYDPEDRRLGTPVPVNPRLFPDLHLGYGDALSSHTKRETLKMRLLSIILNKLGANYYKQAKAKEDTSKLFSIRMSDSDQPITTPWEFVEALMASGHKIEVVPTSRLTTFGVGMCVKEADGSWTNVPLGVFLESGYEDKNGNMAPAMLPHSGLDMYISGPLAGHRADGTPSELALQHFIGIEGFCGWHSHANAQVPFNEAVPAGKRLSGSDAIRATRLAGLYANVLNGLATELGLPFGGYGVTAVCNDSAAILQYILYGEITIYPMTSIGRFVQRTMRYTDSFRQELMDFHKRNSTSDLINQEVEDLKAIKNAMLNLPSDINAAPSNMKDAGKRMIHTLQPKLPFVLMTDTKRIMESILDEDNVEAENGASPKKLQHVPR